MIDVTSKKWLKKQPLEGKTAIVMGGSTGIGKATARELVKLGGSVCIAARHEDALQRAVEDLAGDARGDDQFVEYWAVDATREDLVRPLVDEFVDTRGVPAYLVNCVGYARTGYVQDMTVEDFRRNMEVNYFGQLVPTLCLLPHFVAAGGGHVGCVSSASGFLGLIGYAPYTPTKYAIRGLVEGLRHELKPHGIKFSLLFPSDTQTPGFDRENETKPEENRIISANDKVYTPAEIAEEFVEGLLKEKFYILPGMSGMMYWLARHFPRLFRRILDGMLRKARAKLGKSTDY